MSLKAWLDGVDYPAEKETLVQQARHNEAPEHAIAALQAMPPMEYANRAEVAASIEVSDNQNDSEKAKQRRHHRRSGLAEKETETPNDPIAEELGDNRKE